MPLRPRAARAAARRARDRRAPPSESLPLFRNPGGSGDVLFTKIRNSGTRRRSASDCPILASARCARLLVIINERPRVKPYDIHASQFAARTPFLAAGEGETSSWMNSHEVNREFDLRKSNRVEPVGWRSKCIWIAASPRIKSAGPPTTKPRPPSRALRWPGKVSANL